MTDGSLAKRVLFRCDASPQLGIGHVMRCLVFAQTLRWAGWSCAFMTNAAVLDVAPALKRSGFDLLSAENDIRADAALVVVDHYGLAATNEAPYCASGATVVAFDDLADRKHNCAVLLDPTPGRSTSDYAALVPQDCRLLLGPRYAMVGEAWLTHRAAAQGRHAQAPKIRRVLVSMGGTDAGNATGLVLAALKASGISAHFDVVLGAGAPYRTELARLQNEPFTLHIDHPNVASLAAQADLAIGAAGSSSFERAVLGLPTILVTLADNQTKVAAAFAAAEAAEIIPAGMLTDAAGFGAVIARLANDPARRAVMAQRATALTDGRGALRLLVAAAGRAKTKTGRDVFLRLAEVEDELWLLDLQRQESTRRFARNPAVPSAAEHAAWFASVLAGRDRMLLIVEIDGKPCGMLRLDRQPGMIAGFEISIAIDAAFHGEGIASAALALARRMAPGADLIATVLPGNRPSLSLFAAAGYRSEGGDRYRLHAA